MKKQGFSLMEMMIVLLITAIIAAATAPMVSKKMMRDAGAGNSPWMYAGLNGSIVYNPDGNTSKTAMIGTVNSSGSDNVRLLIESKDDPQLALKSSTASEPVNVWVNGKSISFTNKKDGMHEGITALGYSANSSAENSTSIGYNTNAFGKNSLAVGVSTSSNDCGTAIGDRLSAGQYAVAIGSNTSADASRAVAIGHGSYGDGACSIAIGFQATGSLASAIAIGSGTTSSSTNSIAIGHYSQAMALDSFSIGAKSHAASTGAIAVGKNATSTGQNSSALGYSSNASAENSIALGRSSKASNTNSIAIGPNAIASGTNSVAIGGGAKASSSHQIVLGTSSDTVKIPGTIEFQNLTVLGELHVKGNTYLAENEGCMVHLRAKRQNRNDWRQSAVYMRDSSGDNRHNLYITSDRRLKNVGEVFSGGLNKIKQLKVYNYTFKNDSEKTPHVGVIAQDLQKVFPNAVTKGEDGFLRIRWDEMFYAMINAIKELDIRTSNDAAALRKENSELKKQVSDMQYQIKNLEKRLDKLESRK